MLAQHHPWSSSSSAMMMPAQSPGFGGQTSQRPMNQLSSSASALMEPTAASSSTAPTPLALSAIFLRHS
eukprot:10917006-Heterocapsa_arctica.AAC.1